MADVGIWVAAFDYTATKADELSLRTGEEIKVTDRSGGSWWYGRKCTNGVEGWFPADYVTPKSPKNSPRAGSASPRSMATTFEHGADHHEEFAPEFTSASVVDVPLSSAAPVSVRTPRTRQVDESMNAFRSKEECLLELLASEERYLEALIKFTSSFLEGIRLRDTHERRTLCYGNKAVAVAFDLLRLICAHNTRLLEALRQAGTDHNAIARAFLKFAPAEKAYALLGANHQDAMAGLEKLAPTIAKYTKDCPIPGGHSLQKYFSMPLERFGQYLQFLTVAQRLCPASAELTAAHKAMGDAQDLVDDTVDEFNRQTELVTLQGQFMGYVDLYGADRRLLKEATLKKIYIDNSGRKPQDRHIHLFNDALIYSSKMVGPYKYKLAKVYTLEEVEHASLKEDGGMFDIKFTDGDSIRFQAPDAGVAMEWVLSINQASTDLKAKVADKAAHGKPLLSREARVSVVEFLKKHASIAMMPERSKTVAYGLKADLTSLEYFKVFGHLADTLDEISRGVKGGDNVEERGKGLFETNLKALTQATEGTMNRMKAQAQGKPLQNAEVGVFIKVVPVIAALMQNLTEELDARLTAHSAKGTHLCLGDVYVDLSALFEAFRLYATVVEEATAVLQSKELAEFLASIRDQLAPLTLEQHLSSPFDVAQRMEVQLRAVLDKTPADHPDRRRLEEASALASATVDAMNRERECSVQYKRLVAIRNSIANVDFRGENPLEHLINNTRNLIRDGVLVKKSRSKNQTLHFWLFNDCLLYGTPVPGTSSFQFNRWLNLTEIKVAESTSERMGIDVLSAEKSFVVVCKDEEDKARWLEALGATIQAAKVVSEVPEDNFKAAPILVQSSDCKDCTLCHQPFTFWVRKHHCMKCGQVVCDKCSPNRMLLPNISKTERQRVCQTCLDGSASPKKPAAPLQMQAPAPVPPTRTASPPAVPATRASSPPPRPVSSSAAPTAHNPFQGDDDHKEGRKPNPFEEDESSSGKHAQGPSWAAAPQAFDTVTPTPQAATRAASPVNADNPYGF